MPPDRWREPVVRVWSVALGAYLAWAYVPSRLPRRERPMSAAEGCFTAGGEGGAVVEMVGVAGGETRADLGEPVADATETMEKNEWRLGDEGDECDIGGVNGCFPKFDDMDCRSEAKDLLADFANLLNSFGPPTLVSDDDEETTLEPTLGDGGGVRSI